MTRAPRALSGAQLRKALERHLGYTWLGQDSTHVTI
jgi:hypothetical protein